MANSMGNGAVLKWIMGIVSSLLVAAIIGLWTKVDMMQVEVAQARTERTVLRRDMDELKQDTKEILAIVTDIRIQMAGDGP